MRRYIYTWPSGQAVAAAPLAPSPSPRPYQLGTPDSAKLDGHSGASAWQAPGLFDCDAWTLEQPSPHASVVGEDRAAMFRRIVSDTQPPQTCQSASGHVGENPPPAAADADGFPNPSLPMLRVHGADSSPITSVYFAYGLAGTGKSTLMLGNECAARGRERDAEDDDDRVSSANDAHFVTQVRPGPAARGSSLFTALINAAMNPDMPPQGEKIDMAVVEFSGGEWVDLLSREVNSVGDPSEATRVPLDTPLSGHYHLYVAQGRRIERARPELHNSISHLVVILRTVPSRRDGWQSGKEMYLLDLAGADDLDRLQADPRSIAPEEAVPLADSMAQLRAKLLVRFLAAPAADLYTLGAADGAAQAAANGGSEEGYMSPRLLRWPQFLDGLLRDRSARLTGIFTLSTAADVVEPQRAVLRFSVALPCAAHTTTAAVTGPRLSSPTRGTRAPSVCDTPQPPAMAVGVSQPWLSASAQRSGPRQHHLPSWPSDDTASLCFVAAVSWRDSFSSDEGPSGSCGVTASEMPAAAGKLVALLSAPLPALERAMQPRDATDTPPAPRTLTGKAQSLHTLSVAAKARRKPSAGRLSTLAARPGHPLLGTMDRSEEFFQSRRAALLDREAQSREFLATAEHQSRQLVVMRAGIKSTVARRNQIERRHQLLLMYKPRGIKSRNTAAHSSAAAAVRRDTEAAATRRKSQQRRAPSNHSSLQARWQNTSVAAGESSVLHDMPAPAAHSPQRLMYAGEKRHSHPEPTPWNSALPTVLTPPFTHLSPILSDELDAAPAATPAPRSCVSSRGRSRNDPFSVSINDAVFYFADLGLDSTHHSGEGGEPAGGGPGQLTPSAVQRHSHRRPSASRAANFSAASLPQLRRYSMRVAAEEEATDAAAAAVSSPSRRSSGGPPSRRGSAAGSYSAHSSLPADRRLYPLVCMFHDDERGQQAVMGEELLRRNEIELDERRLRRKREASTAKEMGSVGLARPSTSTLYFTRLSSSNSRVTDSAGSPATPAIPMFRTTPRQSRIFLFLGEDAQ